MNKFLFFAVALLTLCTVFFYLKHPLTAKVNIGTHTIRVEVAATNAEKEKGLGDRNALAPDAGMLFPYDHKDRYVYWMKGMRFPLDYIWIDGNTVVDLTPNVPAPTNPSEEPVRVHARAPIDKVLEVNAGSIDRLQIKIGDTVQFTD